MATPRDHPLIFGAEWYSVGVPSPLRSAFESFFFGTDPAQLTGAATVSGPTCAATATTVTKASVAATVAGPTCTASATAVNAASATCSVAPPTCAATATTGGGSGAAQLSGVCILAPPSCVALATSVHRATCNVTVAQPTCIASAWNGAELRAGIHAVTIDDVAREANATKVRRGASVTLVSREAVVSRG